MPTEEHVQSREEARVDEAYADGYDDGYEHGYEHGYAEAKEEFDEEVVFADGKAEGRSQIIGMVQLLEDELERCIFLGSVPPTVGGPTQNDVLEYIQGKLTDLIVQAEES